MDSKLRSTLLFFAPLTLTLIVGGFVIIQKASAATNSYVNANVEISVCGDGVAEGPEQCDGADMGGGSCASLGYTSGTVSCTIACDYDASLCEYIAPHHGGGGGGGGGVVTVPVATQVNFMGIAYPFGQVVILRDGQIATTTMADAAGNFSASVLKITGGNYVFGVYSVDGGDFRSAMQTITLNVTEGVVTTVSGIYIAPTIWADKSEVKKGESINFSGHSLPGVDVNLIVSSTEIISVKVKTNAAGAYAYTLDTTDLILGDYFAKAQSFYKTQVSPFSKIVNFKIGSSTVVAKQLCDGKILKGDLNGDCRVNLVDFSIAAYWYKRTLSNTFILKEAEQLNADDKINLTDFSIMAYYWTG
ncbi:MAG: hypothetical protein WC457_03855 [Patescibacteria group bacterium]